MKGKILSLAVVSIVCANIAEARFFIGVDGGYTATFQQNSGTIVGNGNTRMLVIKPSSWKNAFKDRTWSNGSETYKYEPSSGFNVNFNFGSESFFLNNLFGIRIGGLVGYTNYSSTFKVKNSINNTRTKVTETSTFLDAGVNLDLMLNFWSNRAYSFGIFGGVETDYYYLLQNKIKVKDVGTRNNLEDFPSRHAFDLAGRVGVSTLMANHHRLDVLAKLPIGSIVSGNDEKLYIAPMPSTISINVGYKYIF